MWPSFDHDYIVAVSRILKSGKVNYWTGEECRKFEKEFAEYFDSNYAIALANGTLALDLAFNALNIGKGDEVIVTSRTFIASVSSIINAGATPVFVDVCLNSQNILVSEIERNLSPRTKAIVCVHLAGWPCEMEEILQIAKKNNLSVIEDCAQAHGAMYNGKAIGSIGDIGCWSFCQDKIMTTGGEGGMVTTNDLNLWKRMWAYKDHGKSYDAVYNKKHKPGFRWLHESFGTNWRMTEMQAAIGRIQLKRMPEWTKKRNLFQSKIWENCSSLSGLRVPQFNSSNLNVHGAYKAYVFVIEDKLKEGWNRDKIIEELGKNGVECFSGSCSEVYLEKAFDGKPYKPKKRLRNAKQLGETSLMFLIHPTISEEEIETNCKCITEVMQKAQKNL
jgi:dTDP-4-amino-4,6-dideoxygalactose transaminase